MTAIKYKSSPLVTPTPFFTLMTIKRDNDPYLQVVHDGEEPQRQTFSDESLRIDFETGFVLEEPSFTSFNSFTNNSSSRLSLSVIEGFDKADHSMDDFERRVMEIITSAEAAVNSFQESSGEQATSHQPRRSRRASRDGPTTSEMNGFGFDSLVLNRERASGTTVPRPRRWMRRQARTTMDQTDTNINNGSSSSRLFNFFSDSNSYSSFGQFANDSLSILQRRSTCPKTTSQAAGTLELSESGDIRFIDDVIDSECLDSGGSCNERS